jgi:hypothetical protein
LRIPILWPIAFLRIFVGCLFILDAGYKLYMPFLKNYISADALSQNPFLQTICFNFPFVKSIIEYNHFFIYGELFLGIVLAIGLFIPVFSMLAIFVNLTLLFFSSYPMIICHQLLIAVEWTLFFTLAGRIWGLDGLIVKKYPNCCFS